MASGKQMEKLVEQDNTDNDNTMDTAEQTNVGSYTPFSKKPVDMKSTISESSVEVDTNNVVDAAMLNNNNSDRIEDWQGDATTMEGATSKYKSTNFINIELMNSVLYDKYR